MAGCKLCKQGIKNILRDELQCDYGFIKCLMKSGTIQQLQDAYADPEEADARVREIKDAVKERYKEYCQIRNLDWQADNRNNKDYLKK